MWLDSGVMYTLKKNWRGWASRYETYWGSNRKYVGEPMEKNGYFSKICLCKVILILTPLSLRMWVVLLFLGRVGKREGREEGRRGHLHTFRQRREGQRTLPASVDSPLLSAPKSPDAKVFWGGISWTPSVLNSHLTKILWTTNKITKYINTHTLTTIIYKTVIIIY